MKVEYNVRHSVKNGNQYHEGARGTQTRNGQNLSTH